MGSHLNSQWHKHFTTPNSWPTDRDPCTQQSPPCRLRTNVLENSSASLPDNYQQSKVRCFQCLHFPLLFSLLVHSSTYPSNRTCFVHWPLSEPKNDIAAWTTPENFATMGNWNESSFEVIIVLLTLRKTVALGMKTSAFGTEVVHIVTVDSYNLCGRRRKWFTAHDLGRLNLKYKHARVLVINALRFV